MVDRPAERSRILEVAYECLDRNAGASLSVGDILEASGLATRAFYRHFPSKDDLLVAMIRNDADLVMGELHAATAATTSSREALHEWCRCLLRVVAGRRRRMRVSVFSSPEAQRARGYWAERTRFSALQQAVLSQILHEGRARGEFPWCQPQADARALRAALEAAVDEQLSGAASVGPEEAAEQVYGFALRALGPRQLAG